jgi:hypothetical protein
VKRAAPEIRRNARNGQEKQNDSGKRQLIVGFDAKSVQARVYKGSFHPLWNRPRGYFFFARTAARMISPCFSPRTALRKSYPARAQANREYGAPHYGRHDALEATSIDGKLGFENRMIVIQHCAASLRNGVQCARCLAR